MSKKKKRTTIMQIRTILRLKESEYSTRKISKFLNIGSKSTITRILNKANELNLKSSDLELLTDEQVRDKFFPPRKRTKFVLPDWSIVDKEFSKKDKKKKMIVTLQLLHEEYIEFNKYNPNRLMSYTTFTRGYKAFRNKTEPVMLMSYEPGEMLFVDYAGVTLDYYDELTDQIKKAYFFVGQLGYSNKIFAEVTEDMKSYSWISSHKNMFDYFNGVSNCIMPDNLKTAIIKSLRYQPIKNKDYNDFSNHYNFEIVPARVRKPKDKGKVENGVLQVERRIIAPLRHKTYSSVAEINEDIKVLLEKLNNRNFKGKDYSRNDLFKEEKAHLKPLPQISFEPGTWYDRKVPSTYHLEIDNHKYSVHYSLIDNKISIKATSNMIYIYYENKMITSHVRSYEREKKTTKQSHMPEKHLKQQESLKTENILERAKNIDIFIYEYIKNYVDKKRSNLVLHRYMQGVEKLVKKYNKETIVRIFIELEECLMEFHSLDRIETIVNQFNANKGISNVNFTTLKNMNVRGKKYFA